MEAIGMREKDLEFSIMSGSDEEMLFGCIDSLRKIMKDSAYSWGITVTCNTTHDGLPNRLRSRFPNISLFENNPARGFAETHNRVLRISRARFVWLVDDDVVVLPDAVQLVTEYLDRPENARIGVTGPQLLKPDGTLQPSNYDFPSMRQRMLANLGLGNRRFSRRLWSPPVQARSEQSLRFRPPAAVLEVDTVPRGCIVLRMHAFRQAGPMIEGASAGSEILEWHQRFHEQGWKVTQFAEATVIDYGGRKGWDGHTNLDPERLRDDLFFFRSGRGPAAYSVFCAGIAVTFAARAAAAWLRRDSVVTMSARQCASIAIEGLGAPESPASLPTRGAPGAPDWPDTTSLSS